MAETFTRYESRQNNANSGSALSFEKTTKDRRIKRFRPTNSLSRPPWRLWTDGEWPRTEAEIHAARVTTFVALVIQRNLIAVGREDEVEDSTDLSPASCPSRTAERILRGVYLLSTINRDETLRDGHREEFERIHKEAPQGAGHDP
jgi:hypothetical protein